MKIRCPDRILKDIDDPERTCLKREKACSINEFLDCITEESMDFGIIDYKDYEEQPDGSIIVKTDWLEIEHYEMLELGGFEVED